METRTIYDYITQEEAAFKTARVPVTGSKDWNMSEHIERCTNVANGWFHSGKNDGLRPYKNIVMPIINVARRSEGFDVKDIEPYVNDEDNYHKSFLVRKYHPKWARTNNMDTFIDDVVESSVVYDLALVKSVNDVRPEVVPLQQIAFCDQTDILSGPIALKHQYSPSQLLEFSDRWEADKIMEAVVMCKPEKTSPVEGQPAKTPGKYIEVYELHGDFPESWLDGLEGYENGSPNKYCAQVHICTFYTNANGEKNGITLFRGKETESIFKALVNNGVYGRACGLSLVEQMFEPQVWTNYSEIKIKQMLDAAALMLLQTSDKSFKTKNKISNLENNTVLTHEQGGELSQVNITPQNMADFTNHQARTEENARTNGSARDAQLGISPTSGTPLGTTEIITSEGQGIHEWKQGRIATFISEVYRDWVLKFLVKEMDSGQKFLEELSIDELEEVAQKVMTKESNNWVRNRILETGDIPTTEERDLRMQAEKEGFVKKGSKRFMEVMKGELKSLPVDVFINIRGKQKNMVKEVVAISNLARDLIANPDGFKNSGMGKLFNEMIENSGFSPINFAEITTASKQAQPLVEGQAEKIPQLTT
jgi:hypothetical protein